MGGIELADGALIVDRPTNQLDELAITFSGILGHLSIDHVYVAGSVSIFAGRSRSADDVDVLVERIDEETCEELVGALEDRGFWGLAMPLTSMFELLDEGDNTWVAPDEQITPTSR